MALDKSGQLRDVLKIARACIENGNYRPTFHAECRRLERDITLFDALHIIKLGYRARDHDEYKVEYASWNYAIEGRTLQGDKLEPIQLKISAIVLI